MFHKHRYDLCADVYLQLVMLKPRIAIQASDIYQALSSSKLVDHQGAHQEYMKLTNVPVGVYMQDYYDRHVYYVQFAWSRFVSLLKHRFIL